MDSNTASLDWKVYTVHWQTANTTLYRPVTISIPVDMASVSVVPVASNIMCILSMVSLGHAFGTDQKVHVFICNHSYNRITAMAHTSADFHAIVGGANLGTWLDAIWKN